MAATAGGQEGALTGATPVTIVSAPAAGVRRVVAGIGIPNCDTAIVTLTISKNKGGTLRRLARVDLDPDDTLIYGKRIVLDDTNESVEAVLSGAAATTNPDYDSAYVDYS